MTFRPDRMIVPALLIVGLGLTGCTLMTKREHIEIHNELYKEMMTNMMNEIMMTMMMNEMMKMHSLKRAGTNTRGGVRSGAKVIYVTSLADSGKGTLREALNQSGPRVIVFEVAGYVTLTSDLRIFEPFVTIAGQTAPAPGIIIRGATLRIRTHDVVIQHVAIRPGPSHSPDINRNRDAISIGGGKRNTSRIARAVRIENVSASWSVDEVIGLWRATTNEITIRNSIIAEALNRAGHPKGRHSMGMLIGKDVQGVEVVGNLFVSNMYRNPVVGKGASAFVANNFVYNPGQVAMRVDSKGSNNITKAAFIGNVIEKGIDSSKRLGKLLKAKTQPTRADDIWIYVHDNIGLEDVEEPASKTQCCDFRRLNYAPVISGTWKIQPSGGVRSRVLRFAGSRPQSRNKIDKRIVNDIQQGRGHIIDHPRDVGGFPLEQVTRRHLEIPERAFEDSGVPGLTRIESWLCLLHFEVGGGPTPECREPIV